MDYEKQIEALANRVSLTIKSETNATSSDAVNAAWAIIEDLGLVPTDSSRRNQMVMFQTAWLERA